MQQIERYGVIALVLMLVTILAVSLWDGDSTEDSKANKIAAAGTKGGEATRRAPSPKNGRRPAPNTRADDSESSGGLPLSNRAPGTRPKTNIKSQNDTHADRAQAVAERGRPRATAWRDSAASAERQKQNRTAKSFTAGTEVAEAAEQSRFSTGIISVPPEKRNRSARERGRKDPVELVKTPKQASARKARAMQIPPSKDVQTWTVRPGDSLAKIAKRALGDELRWKEIQTLNGVTDPQKLIVGKVLKLPTGATASPSGRTASSAVAPVASGGATYVVKSGDILGRIAQRELGSVKYWPDIVALNPGINPDRLVVGAKLRLPAAAEGAGKRPDAAPRLARATSTKNDRYRIR